MASKTQDQRLAFEAMVRANAVSYSIQLFIGRGQFERAEADTLAGAISIGKAMKEAHPTCHAQPIYYAIEPSGHSTTITPAQFQESTNMIKTAVTTESAAANVVNIEALRREKNAARAAKKAAKSGEGSAPYSVEAGAAPTNEQLAEFFPGVAFDQPTVEAKIEQVEEALVVEAPADLGFIPPPVEPSTEDESAYAEIQGEPQIGEPPVIEPAKSVERMVEGGLEKSRNEAIAQARMTYGTRAVVGTDFAIKKTARGEWFWGPVEAAKKSTPAKGARKSAKAGPAPKATKATPASKAASGKRADVLAAAERGEIPAAPDFTADTHKRFRPALADVVAMVEAGNVAGLKANKIEPLSSSRAAICRYRDLAIVALKAKAR